MSHQRRLFAWDQQDKDMSLQENPFNMWPNGNCRFVYHSNDEHAKRHASGWAMRNTNNHNITILKKSCLGVLVCSLHCRQQNGECIAIRPAICDKARHKQIGRACPNPAGCNGRLVMQLCKGHQGYPVTHFWRHIRDYILFVGKGVHDHPKPELRICGEKRRAYTRNSSLPTKKQKHSKSPNPLNPELNLCEQGSPAFDVQHQRVTEVSYHQHSGLENLFIPDVPDYYIPAINLGREQTANQYGAEHELHLNAETITRLQMQLPSESQAFSPLNNSASQRISSGACYLPSLPMPTDLRYRHHVEAGCQVDDLYSLGDSPSEHSDTSVCTPYSVLDLSKRISISEKPSTFPHASHTSLRPETTTVAGQGQNDWNNATVNISVNLYQLPQTINQCEVLNSIIDDDDFDMSDISNFIDLGRAIEKDGVVYSGTELPPVSSFLQFLENDVFY